MAHFLCLHEAQAEFPHQKPFALSCSFSTWWKCTMLGKLGNIWEQNLSYFYILVNGVTRNSKLSQYPKSGISSHCKKWNIYSESNLILVYVMLRETLLSYMLVMGKRKHFKKKKNLLNVLEWWWRFCTCWHCFWWKVFKVKFLLYFTVNIFLFVFFYNLSWFSVSAMFFCA